MLRLHFDVPPVQKGHIAVSAQIYGECAGTSMGDLWGSPQAVFPVIDQIENVLSLYILAVFECIVEGLIRGVGGDLDLCPGHDR